MLTIPADAICLGWPHDNIPQASSPPQGVIPVLVTGTHFSTRRESALLAAVRRAAGPCLASTSSLRRTMGPGHKARDDTGAWSWPMRRPLPERFSVAPPTSIIRALACPTTGRIIDAPMSACPTDARPTPRCHPGDCLPRHRPGSPARCCRVPHGRPTHPQVSSRCLPAPAKAGVAGALLSRTPRTLDPPPGVIPALVAGTHASTRHAPALRAAVRRAAGPCLASTSSLRRAMGPGHKTRDDTGAWSWPMRRPLPERFSVAPPPRG
jgi:hypothetical protein